jgi:hypothetical protein
MEPSRFSQIAAVTIDGHSLYLTMVLHPARKDEDGTRSDAWIEHALSDRPLAANTPNDEYISYIDEREEFPPVSDVAPFLWELLTEAYIEHTNYIDAPEHAHHRARLIYRLFEEAGVYEGEA